MLELAPLLVSAMILGLLGGGGSLGKDEVGYAMRERLLPLSLIATPNLPEARILAELPEGTADECAAKLLPYIKHLLITGGHGDEHEVHNRLYSRDGTQQTFTCQRLPGSYHGSGCTLASALAGRIAQGEGLVSAVQSALNYTWRTLRDAEQLGQGQFVPRRLPLDFCHNRAQFIAQRVEEIFDTVQNLLLSQSNYRYLLQVQRFDLAGLSLIY